MTSEGLYVTGADDIYNGDYMSMSDSLWFTFDGQSLPADDTYLLTGIAKYDGKETQIVLYIDCDKPVNGINLVFSSSNDEIAQVNSQYEFNDPVEVTYQFGEDIEGYCYWGYISNEGDFRILGFAPSKFDSEGTETSGEETYLSPDYEE